MEENAPSYQKKIGKTQDNIDLIITEIHQHDLYEMDKKNISKWREFLATLPEAEFQPIKDRAGESWMNGYLDSMVPLEEAKLPKPNINPNKDKLSKIDTVISAILIEQPKNIAPDILNKWRKFLDSLEEKYFAPLSARAEQSFVARALSNPKPREIDSTRKLPISPQLLR